MREIKFRGMSTSMKKMITSDCINNQVSKDVILNIRFLGMRDYREYITKKWLEGHVSIDAHIESNEKNNGIN